MLLAEAEITIFGSQAFVGESQFGVAAADRSRNYPKRIFVFWRTTFGWMRGYFLR